jgi:hypothetical protein
MRPCSGLIAVKLTALSRNLFHNYIAQSIYGLLDNHQRLGIFRLNGRAVLVGESRGISSYWFELFRPRPPSKPWDPTLKQLFPPRLFIQRFASGYLKLVLSEMSFNCSVSNVIKALKTLFKEKCRAVVTATFTFAISITRLINFVFNITCSIHRD